MEKARAVGNTSLAGAKKLLTHPEDEQQIVEIVNRCAQVSLADDLYFKEAYIRNMDIW